MRHSAYKWDYLREVEVDKERLPQNEKHQHRTCGRPSTGAMLVLFIFGCSKLHHFLYVG